MHIHTHTHINKILGREWFKKDRKTHTVKEKNDKYDYIKIFNFCSLNDTWEFEKPQIERMLNTCTSIQ